MSEEKSKGEEGGEIFSDVFGADKDELAARERLEKLKAEKALKDASKQKAPKEKQEGPAEEKPAEEPLEERPARKKKPAKKTAVRIPVKEAGPESEIPEKKELKQKIKKVILAKAAKAAVKDEAKVFDKEVDIKEKGIKEKEKIEEEKENEGEDGGAGQEISGSKGPVSKFALNFLQDEEGNVFIGRKQSVFQKYGNEAGLYLGNVAEQSFDGKRVLLDGLNPHVVFVCGARGSGKCLTGDTLITLENGLVVPISELEKADGRVLGLQHSLKIGPLHRKGFFKRKAEKILKVKLRSGKEIKLTPEHPLLAVDGWKSAEDLEIGSRIATPRKLPAFGNIAARECDVKLMSYLLAEGHLGNNFVLFTNADSEIQGDFFESVHSFDENLKILPHGKFSFRVSQKKKKIDISNIARNNAGQFTSGGFIVAKKSVLTEWLVSLGIYGKKSPQKFIPDNFLQLKKEQLALFLNRLFSCDGSIYRVSSRRNNWCIDYCSSSGQLIRQVQNLLLRFGILSTLRQKTVKTNGKRFTAFELVVYGENVLKFINEIGFFGAKEKKQETALQEMIGLNRNPNTDTVPKEVWNDFNVSNWAEAGRQIGYASPKSLHSSVAYAPSREKLLRLAQIEQNIGIQTLAQADIFWDEIVEKTELTGEFEVFDISVPVHHNFVANDIIVHNSYLLGVLAEELALKNPNVGLVVIDPVGVFWGMRHPNKEEKELESLAKLGLLPRGLDNLKVFIPRGMADKVPKNTFDAAFSMPASLLTAEDWCLTFGIDRFSPSGLLLEKVLHKTKQGYKTKEGKTVKQKDVFDLEDIIECLHNDNEINSSELGYKSDSIRALASRFDAAKAWGVFDSKGTPLIEISKENQLTIIDTSFLDDNVSALIIGILARRILAARKLSTRREAASKFKEESVEAMMELGIPPTWLFIDEAHTLIPSGNLKTPASNSLVEYVKQGRQPGCSLVFATQQPSAIDTHVLSQLDIIVAHKLVFDDDIKAVYKRTPTIIPKNYKASNFIKTLPVGVSIVGDRREETSRAFVMRTRARMSQHEGREAVTSERSSQTFDKSKVQALAVGMAFAQIERKPAEASYISQIVQTLNTKYKSTLQLSEVLDALEKKGVTINPKNSMLSLPGEEAEQEVIEEELEETEKEVQKEVKSVSPEESISLMAFPINLQEESARKLFDKLRKKKTLGLFGREELVEKISLKYLPIYHVTFNVFNEKGSFNIAEAYVDSHTGEFLHFDADSQQFVESTGLNLISGLDTLESRIVLLLSEKKCSFEELQKRLGEDEKRIEQAIDSLMEQQAISLDKAGGETDWFLLKIPVDLPKSPLHALLTSVKKVPVEEIAASNLEKPKFDKSKFQTTFSKIWGKVQIKAISEVFLPRYEAIIRKQDNSIRVISVEAFSGKPIEGQN
ncbi:MAG: DUF853 family protein [Candidatus ainarchaeum sp.]|nr:DUF853 family protein [Candidatus ainarchaeum sp.]